MGKDTKERLGKQLQSQCVVKYLSSHLGCACVWAGKGEEAVDKKSFPRKGKYFVKKVIYFLKGLGEM